MSVHAIAVRFSKVVGHVIGSRNAWKRAKDILRGTLSVEKQHYQFTKKKQISFQRNDRYSSTRSLHNRLVGYVWKSSATLIGRRFLRHGRLPVFAFVGMAMAYQHNDETGTKINLNDDICDYIKEIFGAHCKDRCQQRNTIKLSSQLSDYAICHPIGVGCNGIVFNARLKTDSMSAGNSDDLAIKMIYNYNIQSNHSALMKAYQKELLPLRSDVTIDNQQVSRQRRHLPSHPNIVEIYHTFSDSNLEILPDLKGLCPAVLPQRINPDGCGRNSALFLVMKRYDMSLQDYLAMHHGCPSQRVTMVILAQLLEGVHHMTKCKVAHRDLKSDNILVELPRLSDHSCPRVVITDFGCSLADTQTGIRLPLTTAEVDRGGNPALMAPEVKCAKPGPDVVIDYSKADVWSIGTIAYELLGLVNPFYSSTLDSSTYQDQDLPDLPDNTDKWLVKIIKLLLKRNPKERPSASVAATMLHLLLWQPDIWHKQNKRSITLWLLCIATNQDFRVRGHQQNGQVLQFVGDDTENELLDLFLSRVTSDDVSAAVDFLCDEI